MPYSDRKTTETMRSSKSRSRSKSNRPRSIGNIVNRVFDSSGPEGKVRGTPQQIIEKYHMLARDSQLANDRVAAENFQQHAEHYTRMLGEAMRELAAEQEQRREGGNNGSQNGYGQGGYRDRGARDDVPDPAPRTVMVLDVVDESDDSGLVETPETRARSEPQRSDTPRSDGPRGEFRERGPQPDRREDRPRFQPQDRRAQPQPRPPETRAAEAAPAADRPQPVAVEPPQPVLSPMMPSFAPPEPAESGASAKPAAARRPRAPRKPKPTDDGAGGGGPAEAAE
jgi:hypothetical protein